MFLRRSQYVHLVPLPDGREICFHAVVGTAIVLTRQAAAIVRYFEAARDWGEAFLELHRQSGTSPLALESEIRRLVDANILTSLTPDVEEQLLAHRLTPATDRDPLEAVRRHRRASANLMAKSDAAPLREEGTSTGRPQFHIVIVGDCDVRNEAAFLHREGRRRGIEFRTTATSPSDTRLLSECIHHAVIVGALRARRTLAGGSPVDHTGDPTTSLATEARDLLIRMRAVTNAPILMNNLPVPTVQPLGIAERGIHGHRNRYRMANLALERIADEFPDVYITDIEAALAGTGKNSLLDDSFQSFTHLASLGWAVARWPSLDDADVIGVFPDISSLAARVGNDPYELEACVASAHADMLVAILGIDRRKCVIVDLDGTLWPGVLAETRRPFVWLRSARHVLYFYFGIHEALKSLMRRGILLACVSKNDEATVRELWQYDDHNPKERLLVLDDFASVRINWNDKVENIRAVAAELNVAHEHLVFVDDNPVERERVRRALPEVIVLGDDLLDLRRWLLCDPRLQPLAVTAESAARTQLVKARIQREHLRSSVDEAAFRESLQLVCNVARLLPGDQVQRLKELFDRTTQFNTTARKFSTAELIAIVKKPGCSVFTLHVRDRFGDHGLVGGCVVEEGDISALAVSCRILGVGAEHQFVKHVLAQLSRDHHTITASLVSTSRNVPARHIFADHGFIMAEPDSRWQISFQRNPLNA